MKIYLVGGAVRDALLGLPVKEKDYVVVGATPDEMLALGFKQVGKEFPVFLHPKTQEEYALARIERKTGPGYKGFAFDTSRSVTLEEDLSRRDLTINAIAQSETGEIIDPFNGCADLKSKTLRHVTQAFAEDPVRILRVARFSARFAAMGFTVAPETVTLMRQMVLNGEVKHLVAERVWKEFVRALSEPTPQVFIQTLRSCEALKDIFPEIDKLYGVPQPAKWHPEIDCGIHVEMVLAQAAKLSELPEVRFAALCHDLGKGTTRQEEWPSHHGHEERSAKLVKSLCERHKIPNEFKDLAHYVAKFHGHCHKAFELQPKTLLKMIEAGDCFRKPERLEQFVLCCEADARGRTGFEDREYPQADFVRKIFKALKEIDIQALIQKHMRQKSTSLPSDIVEQKGETIKKWIYEERIRVIKELRGKSDL